MTERAVMKQILRVIGSRPDVRLWRSNAGVGRALSNDAVIAFGIPGQGDLTGIVADGRRLEIEVKSATGRQSPQQQRFEAMVKRFNGIYILTRSVDDAVTQLEAALNCANGANSPFPEAACRNKTVVGRSPAGPGASGRAR